MSALLLKVCLLRVCAAVPSNAQDGPLRAAACPSAKPKLILVRDAFVCAGPRAAQITSGRDEWPVSSYSDDLEHAWSKCVSALPPPDRDKQLAPRAEGQSAQSRVRAQLRLRVRKLPFEQLWYSD